MHTLTLSLETCSFFPNHLLSSIYFHHFLEPCMPPINTILIYTYPHHSIHTTANSHSHKNTKMEKAKLAMLITAFAMVAFLLPCRTDALVPYTRSMFDMMFPDDPFKILEHSPLAASRVIDDNALALARADWRETAAEHQIFLDVPGMKRGDIKIEVEDNRVLRISGERRTEEQAAEERWHRVERTVGKFWRQFRMPANADVENVRARLEDGVLKVTVPKLAEKERKKKEAKVITILSDEKEKISGDKTNKEEL